MRIEMSKHEKFHYQDIGELREAIKALHVSIPLSEDLSALSRKVRVGSLEAPNAFAVLPMEGCDSEIDGSPTDSVRRRYERFASGGAGLIWWEANSVVPEGRANPLQMMLTKDNVGKFASLVEHTLHFAQDSMGKSHRPLQILQLTHSGRYSRPQGHKAAPIIPQHDPILDPRVGLKGDEEVVSDGYLEDLVGHYVFSARLAKEAGFDGVDVKACHRYLLSELLASHTRKGKFGGSFENRSRLMLMIVKAIRQECGCGFLVASRFNVFDAHPYPYGFGEDKTDLWRFDPSEPLALTRALCLQGVDLLSNSAGNPYYIYPQVTRPFDLSSMGIPTPEEHPLESIERLFSFTEQIQNAAGAVPVVGNGYTWLRQFIPYVGSANLAMHRCSFIGLGRSSIAYPDAPKDILTQGLINKNKCCITCSKCTQIMRDHGRTGCVIRDNDVYGPLYVAARKEASEREASFQ